MHRAAATEAILNPPGVFLHCSRKMDAGKAQKPQSQKGSPCGVHGTGRRQSLTAQLTRSARRFSAAVAPQLTKLDILPILQKYLVLDLRINDITQLQAAVEQYVVHNGVQFNPIDFEITNEDSSRVLSVSLHPEEMVLTEGARRILSVTFADSESEEEGILLSKIRHPVSGMRVFEFVEQPCSDIIQITSYVDQGDRCIIEPVSSSWLKMLTTCGCLFSRLQWQFKKNGKIIAIVRPNGSFFDENSLHMEWIEQADNELRILVIAFAMTQIVREAFPSLIHILREQRIRR